mgnify:CR=1 FL=1
MNKILVVEDSTSIREEICDILRFEDFGVISAENGEIGLEKAKTEMPNLIISDIAMPKLNGYQLLGELQKSPQTESIPFIFLSAKAEITDVREGMNLGADDYLVKPFNSEELIKVIKSKFNKQKLIKENLDKLRLNIGQSLPHEFLTPLNSILGFSSILKDSEENLDKDFVRKLATPIFENGKRLHALIENYILHTKLLSESYSNNNNINLEEIPLVNFKNFIEQTSKDFFSKKERLTDLKLDVQDFEIRFKEKDFDKIFIEIIENSIKFSIPGNQIKINTYKDNNYFVLNILNEGIGMEPVNLKKIGGFTQFNREQMEQQGGGLGLSIVKLLAKKYNCEISFDSKLNEYFQVKINFPFV